MSVLQGLEPSQKFGVVVGGWWWWSKGILEFRFGPNLGLGLEAWTKLNNKSASTFVFPEFLFLKTIKEQARQC